MYVDSFQKGNRHETEMAGEFVMSEGQNLMINLPFCESEDVSPLMKQRF